MKYGKCSVNRPHRRRVRPGVRASARLICQPDPRPGIKTHPSPAAFLTALSLPFLSPLSRSCTRPHRASDHPSANSTYFLRAPWFPPPRDLYDIASERNASAGPPALIHSTSRQHCLVGRSIVRRPLAVSATGPMEKRPQRDVGSGPAVFRGALGWILLRQASPERFRALVAVTVDLLSFRRLRVPRYADQFGLAQSSLVG